MSLSQLSTVLLSGLDLLICNLTIGAALTGILSIAKTVPMSFATLIATLGNVFTPHYTILYAKNDINGLVTSKIHFKNCQPYPYCSDCRIYGVRHKLTRCGSRQKHPKKLL